MLVKDHRQGTSGFTLVEMLVVLMLLALIASVTLVYLPTRQHTARLVTLASDVKTSMVHTRNMALRSHQDALFRIDFTQAIYWPEGAFQDHHGRGAFPDGVAVELYTAEGETRPDNSAAIRFFPDGSSTGGYVRLTQGNLSYRISVNWLTGRVHIDNERP